MWIEHHHKGRFDLETLRMPTGPQVEFKSLHTECPKDVPDDTIVTVTNMLGQPSD